MRTTPRLTVQRLTARLQAVQFFEQFGEVDAWPQLGRRPTRAGKTRTPFALRNLAPPLWTLKQRLWPNPAYSAAARAWSRRLQIGHARPVSIALFREQHAEGMDHRKIFDCFFAGTVPYRGAPDILDWVPASFFIDMRRFKDFADLRAFLTTPEWPPSNGSIGTRRDYVQSSGSPFRLSICRRCCAHAVVGQGSPSDARHRTTLRVLVLSGNYPTARPLSAACGSMTRARDRQGRDRHRADSVGAAPGAAARHRAIPPHPAAAASRPCHCLFSPCPWID